MEIFIIKNTMDMEKLIIVMEISTKVSGKEIVGMLQVFTIIRMVVSLLETVNMTNLWESI